MGNSPEIDYFDLASSVCNNFRKKDRECYIVGGTVRDTFIGKPVKDLDLATDATPDEIKDIASDTGHKTIEVGEQFGTVVMMVEGEPIEITTFRSEGDYKDGRRPEYVAFETDVIEDLSRRDFTMNALAHDPLTDETVDPFGGRKDIENRTIRAVGNPVERFQEDSLRPVRACRFSSTLGFGIDRKTKQAMKQTATQVPRVSRERLTNELMTIMGSEKPSIGLNCLKDSGILAEVYPELDSLSGVTQPSQFHRHDVWNHTMEVVDALPANNIKLRLAGLLHDIGKPTTKGYHGRITFREHEEVGEVMAEEFARRNKLPKDTREYLKKMVRYHLFPYEDNWRDATLRKFILKVGEENLDDLIELRAADLSGGKVDGIKKANQFRNKIRNRLEDTGSETIEVRDLVLRGDDVMRIKSIGAGPEVGRYLSALHERVLENPKLNTKPSLERMLKEIQ